MRYGADDVESGRRRRGTRPRPRPGQTPIRQQQESITVDPRGQVRQMADPQTAAMMDRAAQQPWTAARQTVNEETGLPNPSRTQFAPEFQRILDRYAAMQMPPSQPPTRPQATPVPFPQQLAQSGMMNTQPISTPTGPGTGYTVNPSHPMWNYARGYTPPGGGPLPPQFSPDRNPMDYYGWDRFRGQVPYQMPGGVQGMQDVGSRGGQAPRQAVPRVWTEREMTPEGFQNIMGQYGKPWNYVPWMRQMQSMPYPVPQMPFGNMPVGF